MFGQLVLKDFSDKDPKTVNKNGLMNFFKHFPAGTSYQNLEHFKQMLDTGEFKMFDYGSEKNQKLYQ